MKIYLAARYSRHQELYAYASQLKKLGYEITSRWIYGNHQISDEALLSGDDNDLRERFAIEDYEDLKAADLVISFTEEPRSGHSRGGRHVEFGMALVLDKGLVVIGHRENIFHCMPGVQFFPDWDTFYSCISGEATNRPAEQIIVEAKGKVA